MEAVKTEIRAQYLAEQSEESVRDETSGVISSVWYSSETLGASLLALSAGVAALRADMVEERFKGCKLEQLLWAGQQREATLTLVLAESSQALLDACAENSATAAALQDLLVERSDLEQRVMFSLLHAAFFAFVDCFSASCSKLAHRQNMHAKISRPNFRLL